METTYTFMAPEGPFEVPEHYLFENDSTNKNWMDVDLDLSACSPEMSLFQEVEDVEEVKEAEINNSALILSHLISECGIPVEEEGGLSMAAPSSPTSSIHSDMEAHQSLIDELEEYFGSPTRIEEDDNYSRSLDLITKTNIPHTSVSPNTILEALATGNVFNADQKPVLTEQDLNDAVTTSCVTEDGQNVIIIIAPPSPPSPPSLTPSPTPSPAPSNISTYDTDPEWVPSPSGGSPLRTLAPTSRTIKKKYQRSKPPTPPTGPYPVEKKERKKAQNRTAAFRYREKKKSELDVIENEMEELAAKNMALRNQLSEMETEAKLLKKLMTEAGLGKYANTLKI